LRVITVKTGIYIFLILSCLSTGRAQDIPVPSEALTIDSIEIINNNVFDLTQPRYDNFLFRLANKFHICTRKSVIRREILLKEGNPYDTSLAYETIRNLRNLDYIFQVDLDIKKGSANENILVVKTSDKWTTTAGVSYHRKGARNDIQLSFKENNLLGYGIFIAHDYFILEEERDYYQGEIRDNRVFGKEFSLKLLYNDSPRKSLYGISTGKPYYRLSQSWAFTTGYYRVNERLDYYYLEELSARDRIKSNNVDLVVSHKIGPRTLKYYFNYAYGYKDNISPQRIYYITDPEQLEDVVAIIPEEPEDSIINYFEVTVGLIGINYHPFRRLNRFVKPEDINLGWEVEASIRAAYPQHQRRYLVGSISAGWTNNWGKLLFLTGGTTRYWWISGVSIRRLYSLYAKSYWRYHPNHTLVAKLKFDCDRRVNSSYNLYLDEENGLRGFPVYYDGGEYQILLNLENRVFSNIEILTVGIGGVIFADIGNVWSRKDAIRFSDLMATVGPGLRFGVSRSSEAEVVRIDFGYALTRGKWLISVGTRQFF